MTASGPRNAWSTCKDAGGVVSAGGVGFDISCGVRLLKTGLYIDEVEAFKTRFADALYTGIPAGVGSHGKLRLSDDELDAKLTGEAKWAVSRGQVRSISLRKISFSLERYLEQYRKPSRKRGHSNRICHVTRVCSEKLSNEPSPSRSFAPRRRRRSNDCRLFDTFTKFAGCLT